MKMFKWVVVAMSLVLFMPVASVASGASKDDTAKTVGKQRPGPKFAKLKLGMTLKDVVAKIGKPTDHWEHPTGKAAIPFYFGPDKWVIVYSYAKEGQLTFNQGEDQKLTDIQVNRSEGKDGKKKK